MPKIIVASRYLKPAAKGTRGNLVKYIATRETVEKYLPKKNNLPATDNQESLIKELLKSYPDGKKLPEFEDYEKNSTKANASELISELLEQGGDLITDREILVKYVAERPGVEKIGKHGLFSDSNDEIILSQAQKNISEHQGNVWSHVISLRREDAERLGYITPEMWRNLVMRHTDDIAKAQNIRLENFRWYAAFHNTAHHPHIHLLVYSENIKEGFLTENGIEQIKSAIVNDIFKNDLYQLYEKQTKVRDNLRAESKKVMQSLLNELQNQNYSDRLLESLLLKLSEQLKTAKGKKVYGYLQPQVKKTVDEIVAELAKNPVLKKMYDEWLRLEREKYLTYTSEPPQLPALQDNKVFKPIKNAVIQAALELRYPLRTPECEPIDPEETLTDSDEPQEKKPSEEHLRKAADRNNPYAMYRLARLYLNSEPPREVEQAVELLEHSAGMQNSTAAYALGRLYLYGGAAVERDTGRAREWLEYSASLGNEYAERLLEDMRQYQNYGVQRAAVGLLRAFARMISDNHRNTSNSPRLQTDRKLRSMIRRKKLALGLKESHEQEIKNY